MKPDKKIESLAEYIMLTIECCSCGATITEYGMEEYDFAEYAMHEGFRVTRSGRVLCKQCKR